MRTFSHFKKMKRQKLFWLNLQECGLSIVERLCLEEALLRHDPLKRCWAIVGTHCAKPHSFSPHKLYDNILEKKRNNNNCAIVMGIGGCHNQLLDSKLVKEEGVSIIKRFSGGGTIVVDKSSLWITFIGRTCNDSILKISPLPQDIMEWSAEQVFSPFFSFLRSFSRPNKLIPPENDYVVGNYKVGGNAQSIVKGGWLHHSSFLWEYVDKHMKYLSLPTKCPSYRDNRDHYEFLMKLNTCPFLTDGDDIIGKRIFFYKLQDFVSHFLFDAEVITLQSVLNIVNCGQNGIQMLFNTKCRTKVIVL